ncbi:hypothetical protein, partial [Melaminivora jejuensis]
PFIAPSSHHGRLGRILIYGQILKHMTLPSNWCHERAATHGACRIYGFAHMRFEVHLGGLDGKFGQTLENFAVRHQASHLT